MNGADLVEGVAAEEADDGVELLNDSGLPRGHRPRMVDDEAEPVALSRTEREGFIDHIARLRQRLAKYEADGDLAGDHARLTADQTVALESRLHATQAELRVAEDSIREHIRQKARLRERIDALTKAGGGGIPAKVRTGLAEMPDRVSRLIRAMVEGLLAEDADAGRGRRTNPDASVSQTDAPAPDVDDPPAIAPSRVASAAAVVDEDRAGASADAGDRDVAPAPAAASPSTDAPVNGKNRPRTKEGWFYLTLKRLGREATSAEVAAADGRTTLAGTKKSGWSVERGLVEVCGSRGRATLYRVKA